MVEDEARKGDDIVFKAYIQIIAIVSSFCYPGQTMIETYNKWPEVVINLQN